MFVIEVLRFLLGILFFLFLLWPLLVILIFDYLYGVKSNLTGAKRILSWFSIHLILNILALSWKFELNQNPSLSLNNIIYHLTYWCEARKGYGCIFNIDTTILFFNIILSTIPGIFIFRIGIKSKKR